MKDILKEARGLLLKDLISAMDMGIDQATAQPNLTEALTAIRSKLEVIKSESNKEG